jgi:adenine deaminase
MKITGQLVDIHKRQIYPAEINIKGKIIDSVKHVKQDKGPYILPGLIDAHIHIESSMVTPGSFAMAAVSRGTTAVVSDPHEIANVLGVEGIMFMINDASTVPVKFFFGAPSCVPATQYESTGSSLNSIEIKKILAVPQIKYLAEVMNFPGVIYNDTEVLKKIEIARKFNKPVDGHAPGLRGENLKKYIKAGITTDHECTTLEEANEKLSMGMKILIREGSAAKNLDELKSILRTNPELVMLCSDDLHPEMLAKQHINKLVARLIKEDFDIFDVIRSCTINPARHYNLEAGMLQQGDPADIILVDDPAEMNVLETWIDGVKVFDNSNVMFNYGGSEHINKFNCSEIRSDDIVVIAGGNKMRVIEAFDGSLITKEFIRDVNIGSRIEPDTESDILKIVVKDRYNDLPASVGFIKGFGLISGAFASSVAHDSHNIICIGTNDTDIVNAVNEIVKKKGGLAVSEDEKAYSLPLPVAGIMSDLPVETISTEYENLSDMVKSMGCGMSAPFMTLSFMALLVIPELKLSDRGLFDGNKFNLVNLFLD